MSRVIENDRITYIYLKLIDSKQKKFIEELVYGLEIASISTARRRFKEMEKWSKSEKALFLATYIPTQGDNKAVDDVLGDKADKASSEVKEEHTSEDKCTECGIEAAHIINELSAKSEKLQEELIKYKNDLNCESKEFRNIIEKMIQLYTSKNKDYGDAFSQSYNEFGAVMSIIRINDKLNRFKTLVRQNSEVKTESVTDTLIDLANYAVMTIMEIENDSQST